ncbi:hypothetical protein PLESTB_001356400 [Pleodorina starrii]|uniref:Uncharacterized protein n=1 Tax=Pleodorina starrii TaxID=330485 RepID=A0A9W6BVS2_9CHLO|nr:hypothetical protein PLESTM_001916200 [Pleodorina starrii]GLC58416.1 hypothetical protein PLESTB_001356400 [Pleodorina starrii]GLC76477.1 hypothetical protein PLESTF_001785500 [Pleodorina starrii]
MEHVEEAWEEIRRAADSVVERFGQTADAAEGLMEEAKEAGDEVRSGGVCICACLVWSEFPPLLSARRFVYRPVHSHWANTDNHIPLPGRSQGTAGQSIV